VWWDGLEDRDKVEVEGERGEKEQEEEEGWRREKRRGQGRVLYFGNMRSLSSNQECVCVFVCLCVYVC
jgi:hypothetical protein